MLHAHTPVTNDGVLLQTSRRQHLLKKKKICFSLDLDHEEGCGGPGEVECGANEIIIGVDAKRVGDRVGGRRGAGHEHDDAQRGRLELFVGRERLTKDRVCERPGAHRVSQCAHPR